MQAQQRYVSALDISAKINKEVKRRGNRGAAGSAADGGGGASQIDNASSVSGSMLSASGAGAGRSRGVSRGPSRSHPGTEGRRSGSRSGERKKYLTLLNKVLGIIVLIILHVELALQSRPGTAGRRSGSRSGGTTNEY